MTIVLIVCIVWVSCAIVVSVMLNRAHTRGVWLEKEYERAVFLAADIASDNAALSRRLTAAISAQRLPVRYRPEQDTTKPWWLIERGRQLKPNVAWRGQA